MARSELSRLRNNLSNKIRYYNNKYGYQLDPSLPSRLSKEELEDMTTQDLLENPDNWLPDEEPDYEPDEDFDGEQVDTWDYDILPDEVDMIIDNFRDSYSKYNGEAQDILNRWLNNLIIMKGEGAVAQMVNDARANGLNVTSNIVYGNIIESFIMDFMEYLPEEDQLGWSELGDLMDSLEMQEDWGSIT